jgi:putative oxidoreductase
VRAAHLIGRAIFGGYFVYNGINHFRHTGQMSAYAASKGTPAAELAVKSSGALLLAGGTSVATGVNAHEGLAAIIAFLVPVTLQMHRFWEAETPEAKQGEMVNFMKNIALVGAALTMMQIPEPWPAAPRLETPVQRRLRIMRDAVREPADTGWSTNTLEALPA